MLSKKLYLFLTLLFITHFAQAQLSNFTLNVTKTDETCTANGTLSFSASNTTSGATMLYSVYLLPNTTTPISVQSSTTISGLSAGDYRVVATQSLGSQNGTQQQDITIVNSIHPLTYELTSVNETCGNDGVITVVATAGSPVSYEIISGPMTRPLQTSNTFTGLTAGVYYIRVFDACHQAVVRTYTLFSSDTALNVSLIDPTLATCTTVTIGFTFQTVLPSPFGVVKFPLQIVTTYSPPTGPTQTYSNTINSGSGFNQSLPFFPNQASNYTFTITDGCGRVYHLNGTIQLPPFGGSSYTIAPQDCEFQIVTFSSVTTLILTTAPPGYVGAVPQSYTSSIVNNAVTVNNLIPGTYTFTATDICGNPQTLTVVVAPNPASSSPPTSLVSNVTCIDGTIFIFEISNLIMTSAPAAYTVAMPHDYTGIINSGHYAAFSHLPVGTYTFIVSDRCGNPSPMTVDISPVTVSPSATVLEGCANGIGSLRISGDLVAISLVSAPAAYSGTVPANLTASVALGASLILDTLPPGNYVFQSVNACNESFTTNATIAGYQENTTVTLTPNCGSFNFNLNHTSNNNNPATFWLQKYDAISGNWVHPLTNAVYVDGADPTTANSFPITNNVTLYNLTFTGHFRILKVFTSYSSGTPSLVKCYRTIYEFDFSDGPHINNVYSISCGSTFEIIVNATGNSALSYRITTKNGQPFLIENGNSSLFSGLEPAIYNFQVEDACGNIVNSQFEVSSPNPVVITATPILCDGDNASLSVPGFSFLTYQWWKGNNTATILSTTNSLNFLSFNAAVNNGVYHVRIVYSGNPNSCLNQVLDYTINVSNAVPHAGNDNSVSYCGSQGVIDLSTLLTGNFDTAGVWSEITSSGMLTNNLWNSTNLTGTYQFKYHVAGLCNSSDDSQISITIKTIPQVPVASVDPVICEGQDLNLFATTVPNSGGYHWSGPNGFTSANQNPVIGAIALTANGTYTVYADQNGCNSGNSTVEVLINPSPAFTLNQGCVGQDYQLWATKLIESSYDETTSTFHWSGPNNFTSNQNTVTISGGAIGTYSLTITNQNGCETTNTIEVERTNCYIPNVITPNNDTANDSFNLAGFGVLKLEIYNRWGRKVFEKNNYIDEWHGQNMSGGSLPDSTYYYVIKLDTEETKVGWIFLSKG